MKSTIFKIKIKQEEKFKETEKDTIPKIVTVTALTLA